MEQFRIQAYGRTELAQIYSPEISPGSAFRKFSSWIDRCPNLRSQLDEMGSSRNARTYTPAQVRLLVVALGEP